MITLRPATWWILAGALSLCLFAVTVVLGTDALETVYFRETEAPELKREFGFDAGHVRHDRSARFETFTITRVTPGGVLAKAGVRAGDQPWSYHGRSELSFYFALEAARSRRVVLRVVRDAPAGRIVEIPLSLRPELPR